MAGETERHCYTVAQPSSVGSYGEEWVLPPEIISALALKGARLQGISGGTG